MFVLFSLLEIQQTIDIHVPIDTICSPLFAESYLDLYIEIENGGILKTKLYDKCYDFTFRFIIGNIPTAPAY